MNVECPKCNGRAMDLLAKVLKRPVVCEGCGQELRMNNLFTAVFSLVYFFIVIRVFLDKGVTGLGMIYVLIVTGLFVLSCLFIPFEVKSDKPETE